MLSGLAPRGTMELLAAGWVWQGYTLKVCPLISPPSLRR